MRTEYEKGLLSVCMVGYNHAKYAKAAVDAVNKIRHDKVELIVLDDGSSDNSAEVLSLLARQSRVPMTPILQANTGNIGHNFNVALSRARGEFVAMISLDDMLIPEKVDSLLSCIIEDKALALIASTKIMGVNESGDIDADSVPPLPIDAVQGAVFRRCVIDAVGGFDEDMTGDDIILRTKVFNYLKCNPHWKFKLVHEPTCMYRQHSTNVHNNSLRQMKIITEYLERYWPDRPNPPMLIDCAMYTLSKMPKNQWVDFFGLNKRALSCLSDGRILEMFEKKVWVDTIIFKIPFFCITYRKRNQMCKERRIEISIFGKSICVYRKVKVHIERER